MKKVIIFLALSIMAFAEIVKIDMDYVMSKHPKFDIVKTELEKEKQRLQSILDIKQNELNTEKAMLDSKGDKVTEEEVVNFYKKEQTLQNLYSQSQSTLSNFKNQKMQTLYNEILTSLEILQKKGKYDAVVDGQAIFLGSDKIKDISEDLVNLLKSTEKINLF